MSDDERQQSLASAKIRERVSTPLTWLEAIAALLCLLLVLRLLFAETFGTWERQVLRGLGLDVELKFAVGVPAVALVLYWRLRRRRWSERSKQMGVPSWLAAMDMLVILLGAGAVLWMAAV